MPSRLIALTAGLAASLAFAAPAVAGEGYAKQTYSITVTEPDDLGRSVTLDADVYLPKREPPARGHPFVAFFHGGGGSKLSGYDAGHAAALAKRGYVTLLYSARGHGDSGGLSAVVGPKEVRDAFDVTAWALGIEGAPGPEHPDFRIDSRRLGLSGYSQGGLHTNLVQAHSSEPELNPYGIGFRALEPGNTPDLTFKALVPSQVVKLSFGAGIAVQAYLLGTGGRLSPLVGKWTAAAAADLPSLYGGGVCERGEHDTPTSSFKADFAERSPGCFVERMTPPSLWAQSLDDGLFPGQMGVRMWRRMASPGNRLYLTMGGHGAPSATQEAEDDKFRRQVQFFDHYLRGRPLRGPEVVYWTREPSVVVPGDSYRYPDGAWKRHSAPAWPPPGVRPIRYELSADGGALRSGAVEGALPLAPLSEDAASDPVAAAALSATPAGTSPIPRQLPATDLPGFIAGFETEPFGRARELSGAPRARLAWTPAGPDTQLALKVFDRAPDGTLTLLSRGIKGIRGASPGGRLDVGVTADTFSARIAPGHSILAWVAASELPFYKPYLPSLGGTLDAGPGSTLTLPLGRRTG